MITPRWLALAGACVLAACGAGGGEDGAPPPPFGGVGGATNAPGAAGNLGVPNPGGAGVSSAAPLGQAGAPPVGQAGAPPVGQTGAPPVGQAGAAGAPPVAAAGAGGMAPVAGAGGQGAAGADSAGAGGEPAVGTGNEGTNPPPPAANCGNLLLCDDFETAAAGGSPDPARWSLTVDFAPNQASSPNITIDNTEARSGNQSVRVIGSGNLREIVGSVPASRFFVRAFMRLSAVPAGGNPVIIGIGGDQNGDVRLRLWQGQLATINSGLGSDPIQPGAATSGNCPQCVSVPNDWFCAEMFVDDAAQSVTVWIDGTEAAAVVNNNWDRPSTWPAFPAEALVRFGFWGLNGGGNTTVWIDDVAVGTERVGCN